MATVTKPSPSGITRRSSHWKRQNQTNIHSNGTKPELVFPRLEPFFRKVNGWVEGEDKNPKKHNYFSIRDLTKSAWFLYFPFQIVGLFNERMAKLTRAFYGACWSIVYTSYRPFATNRKTLGGDKTTAGIKNLYKANEYFRVLAGSAVSAIYGGGAFGMLFGFLTNNDDFFDKSAKVYKVGMFNQNMIFASMNAAIVMARKFNSNKLTKIDREKNTIKAKVELTDTILFPITILTRAVDTLKLFGMDIGEKSQSIINTLSYLGYGTWATRFGIMKTKDEKDGGDLPESHPALYRTQKYSGKVFSTLLPGLSWGAALSEILGFKEVAEKIFNLEGIAERLNPTIFAWCLTNPWLKGYLKFLKPSKTTHLSALEV